MEHSHNNPETRAHTTPRFDLIDVVQTLARRGRFIVLVTLAAVAVGTLAYFFGKKTFKATAEVFIANPVYADRAYIYPAVGVPTIDYFGGEDMIDKAIAISTAESTLEEVARRTGLAKAYEMDTTTLKGRAKLLRLIGDLLVLKRSEYGNLKISYTDKDPVRAATVANAAVQVLEDVYYKFYSSKRGEVVAAMQSKNAEADSAIAVLTDSLAAMRERYGIYEILSPNRTGMMQNNVTTTRNGRAIEEVQNVESLKDQWVIDRARNLGLINQISTGMDAGQTPMMYVLSRAVPPSRRAGLGLFLSVAAWGIAGLIFSSLWVLLSTYARKVMGVQRDESQRAA